MKRLIAIMASAVMVFSMTACNTAESTTSETETSSAASQTETSREETQQQMTVADYVADARSDYADLEKYGEYHVPRILIDSPYASEINGEIEAVFAGYEQSMIEEGYVHYYSSRYNAFLTGNGILSVVFVECGEWDDDVYHVWNIDVNSGERVDNRTMAEIAGVADIRGSAMDAVQTYLNNSGLVHIENYEIVSIEYDYAREDVERSFSEEVLNDNMMIGITSDRTLFFVSPVASFGGAESYYRIYDAHGNDLDNVTGWVGN